MAEETLMEAVGSITNRGRGCGGYAELGIVQSI